MLWSHLYGKTCRMAWYIALILSLLLTTGGVVTAQETPLIIVPDRAFYHPGEPVQLQVTAIQNGQLEVTISFLAETVAVLHTELTGGHAYLSFTPPEAAPRGYGVDAVLRNDQGEILAQATTAFDVLDRWIQAPRYGFLSDFGPDRPDIDSTLDALLPYHINGLQFYDWQYRHAELLPPTEIYSDVLGRTLSMQTVSRLIEAAHARHIAAMPYTAIYGAAPEFFAQHPDWGLYDAAGKPYDFGNGFLKIMNPAPESPWTAHLLDQFAHLLDATGFDGIHLDQYGAPKIGYAASGERIDLAEAFPAFIDAMAAIIREKRGTEGIAIFNAVGNWPVDTVAPSDEDAVYIEVWTPYTRFTDLHRIVVQAQALGGNKPVIIAAYIPPEQATNVRLANAMIFASGGVHLELGEPNAMLADPYFPQYGLMDDSLQQVMARYYHFLVRYENLLQLESVDATAERASALTLPAVKTTGLRSEDRVVVVVRKGAQFEAFSLINLLDIGGSRWDQAVRNAPTPLQDQMAHLTVERPVKALYWASPDNDSLALHPLQFESDQNGNLTFTLPTLAYWNLVFVEYADTNPGDQT
ncbi:MAG: glycoside hydrolase family 66 protein [Anaerolineae bacterium]